MSDSSMSRRDATVAATFGAIAFALPVLAMPAEAKKPAQNDIDALKALLKTQDAAFTAHDLKGVLATFTDNVVMMGTGPGELWVGKKDVGSAFTHFFDGFDKGKQHFERLFVDGSVGETIAWITTVNKVTTTKGDKKTEFGLNSSASYEKKNGRWLMAMLHFSNLTDGAKSHE